MDKKHDCNNFIINSLVVNCANIMQIYKIGDDNFVMSATYCNDHNLGDNASYDLQNLFKPHDEYVCNNIESGFERVSTLGKNNPTYLESVQSCENFDKNGFGEVMTLVHVNPTILEYYKTFMHVDHEEKFLYDSYIIEFDYDPTCNYYESGKYDCRNFHLTKFPPLC